MDAYQQVANKLQELGITFDVVEHPPAFTTEQADSYIEGMEGVRTKSMFLTNNVNSSILWCRKERLDSLLCICLIFWVGHDGLSNILYCLHDSSLQRNSFGKTKRVLLFYLINS